MYCLSCTILAHKKIRDYFLFIYFIFNLDNVNSQHFESLIIFH